MVTTEGRSQKEMKKKIEIRFKAYKAIVCLNELAIYLFNEYLLNLFVFFFYIYFVIHVCVYKALPCQDFLYI